MGWTLEREGETFTTVLPNGIDRTTYIDVLSALACTAYVASWRKDAEDVRARTAWTGPASDLMEGLQGRGLRWLAATEGDGEGVCPMSALATKAGRSRAKRVEQKS